MAGVEALAEQVKGVTHSSQLKPIVGGLLAELAAMEARLKAAEARLDRIEADPQGLTARPARASRKAGG